MDAAQPTAEPQIPALARGEERWLRTVHRADGHHNDFYLLHRRPFDDATTLGGKPIDFVAIIRFSDQDPSDTEPPRAWYTGSTERDIYIRVAEAFCNAVPDPEISEELHPDVQWFVDRIKEEYGPDSTETETIGEWIVAYANACDEVVTTLNACLEAANDAWSARSKAAERPQAEGSIGCLHAVRGGI